MSTLVELFDKYGCDKGNLRHRYDRVYESALKHLQDEEFNMLEIGIFKGNSLQAWTKYFSKANFVGIDIFTRVKPDRIPILDHPRVAWCECDSLDGPNDAFKIVADSEKFDVIIDDGLHTHDAQRITFDNFVPFLKDDGVYFIEDVWAFDHMTKKQKQHYWIKNHPNDYTEEKYEALLKAIQPYKTKFHDCRNGFHSDTFIIEIRK